MAKTIIFKPEFEQKLKELKVKTKFINNLRYYCKAWEVPLDKKIAEMNNVNTFKDFVGMAYIWTNTPEGYEFWDKIANS